MALNFTKGEKQQKQKIGNNKLGRNEIFSRAGLRVSNLLGEASSSFPILTSRRAVTSNSNFCFSFLLTIYSLRRQIILSECDALLVCLDIFSLVARFCFLH